MNNRDTKRQLLLGGGTVLGTVTFLGIIVAVQYIILQHPVRWDLTSGGTYTLAPQSRKVVESFKEKKLPVEVLVFADSANVETRKMVRDLLDQYRDVYADFRYTFYDLDRDRPVAIANKADKHSPVVIKAGDKAEHVGVADEETITNALLRLLRSDIKKIYLLKGHGELSPANTEQDGFSIAKQQVEKQNFKVAELVLLQTNSVPADAAVLVIAGAQVDPFDEELNLIRAYLDKGGNLLVLLQPFKTPNLCALLKDYGVETAEDIVVDNMSQLFGGNYLTPVITTYIKFPITQNFTLASFFPECRSIQVAKSLPSAVEAQELAVTSPVSWTINEERFKANKLNFDQAAGIKGPVSVIAAATRKIAGETKPEGQASAEGQDKSGEGNPVPSGLVSHQARVVVSGSARLAENKYFAHSGNQDLLLNALSWLAGEENLIAIRPKSQQSKPHVLTDQEFSGIMLICLVIIPLVWITAGVTVFVYRRRSVAA